MNNPLLILQTLDRHLDHPVELTLYLTHLFTEAEVFLLPDWLDRRVPLARSFTHLKLLRPATIDSSSRK